MLLVGVLWWENKNKLVEWKVLIDTVGIKSANLEEKFLLPVFCSFLIIFCVALVILAV